MEFTRYRYLVAVAELRSFSKAAEKLFVSQPALTKSIGKLEDELGVKLFDRSSTPIRLTYAGERYIAGMKNVLAMKQQVDQEMQEIAGARRDRLVVGIPETRSSAWLSRILPVFMEKYPGVDVRVVEATTAELEQAAVNDEIDVGIVMTLPIMTAGLEYEPIQAEQLMVVVPPGHRMFGGEDPPYVENHLHFIPPEYLDGQPFISLTPAQGLYRVAAQLFDFHGIKPVTVLELTNTSTAYFMAAEGLGFTIMPVRLSFSTKNQRRPVYCTISDPPVTRQIVATYRKGRGLSPAARHLIDVAKQISASSPNINAPVFKVVYDVP